ncbi:hypothetical protein [Lacticaseibacillus porcinae]|uniref:hypothetical protein n=1 Tax=Lacticaseibacillus porcinae TaxID=1123687 RepID=UPI0013DE5381|nr:hypothetical protein [Lacticaseibacillus porcinae]
MKTMRPIKKIILALGALALAVGGGMVAQSKQSVSAATFADSNAAILAAPWGLSNNMATGVFSGTGSGNTSGTGYSPIIYEMPNQNGKSIATYMQSNKASFDLNKDQNLSFWIYMPLSSTSTLNDGMAFFLTPDANATNTGSKGGMQLGVWGDPTVDNAQPWNTAMPNSYAIEFDTYQNHDWLDKGVGGNYNNITDTIGGAYTSQYTSYAYKAVQVGGVPILGWGSTTEYYYDTSKTNGMNMDGGYIQSNLGNSGKIGGGWRHVTLKYNASDPNSEYYHKLTIWYNDRDLSNFRDVTDDTNYINDSLTKSFKLDSSKFIDKSGKSVTKLYYGFASATKTDQNLVIVDTDSNLLSANASATITDDSNGTEIKNSSYVIRGGEPLTYQYKVNYQTSSNPDGLRNARIHTVLPKYFVPETDTIKLNTAGKESNVSSDDIKPNGDGTYTLDTAVGDLLSDNTTATVTIKGKAKEIKTSDLPAGKDHIDVPSAQALAYNGGIDQKVTDTGFELKPGVKTTTTATIRDFTEVGSPELGSAHVFAGDKLGYTFDVQLDADSPIDWANTITAKVDMPENNLFSDLDLNSDEKLFHVTAVYGSNNVKSGDYTYSQLKAGVPVTESTGLVRNPITNHITVTVTLNLTGKTILNATTATKVPAATVTFESSLHTATAATQEFTAHTPLANQAGAPSILSDTDQTPDDSTAHVDYVNIDQVGDVAEGSDYINLSGYYDSSSVTNDNQITMYAETGQMQGEKWVGHVVHIQLPARATTNNKINGHTGRYNISIPKPDLSGLQSFNSSNAPTTKGQALGTASDQWLGYGMSDISTGKNVVQIYAVDNQGRASTPKRIAFNVGLLKFTKATDATFPQTTLTGSQQIVGASEVPNVTLNNTLGSQWRVTASATAFTTADNTKLKGSLYYVNASGANAELGSEQVAIADSKQLPTTSKDNYDVNLTDGWNKTQPSGDSIDDVKSQGLYVKLNAGATAKDTVEAEKYQSAITWTLTDGPQ